METKIPEIFSGLKTYFTQENKSESRSLANSIRRSKPKQRKQQWPLTTVYDFAVIFNVCTNTLHVMLIYQELIIVLHFERPIFRAFKVRRNKYHELYGSGTTYGLIDQTNLFESVYVKFGWKQIDLAPSGHLSVGNKERDLIGSDPWNLWYRNSDTQ